METRVIKILIYTLLLHFLPGVGFTQQLLPHGYTEHAELVLERGDLIAYFVDNSAQPPSHKAGYNGIERLYHSTQDSNIFVPAYAGFNLEHIFSGDSLVDFFEPRKHDMRLFQKSPNEVLLYQSATPVSKVESLTKFTLVDPHYIDVEFSCVLYDSTFFQHQYAGLFWASYINSPEDRNIYFRGSARESDQSEWISSFSETHGLKSTHIQRSDPHQFYFAENFNASLANHFSNFYFDQPYYFGKFKNMVLAYFFETDQTIRFSQSPTGGGAENPAWDFQFLIPDPVVGKEYTFKARLVYKPFISPEEIAEEYESWLKD